MPGSGNKEREQLLADLNRVVKAWEDRAPERKFSGLTVEEFKKDVQPTFDSHADVSRLQWELERLLGFLADEKGSHRPH